MLKFHVQIVLSIDFGAIFALEMCLATQNRKKSIKTQNTNKNTRSLLSVSLCTTSY